MSYCQIGNLQIMRALEMIMPFGRQTFFPQTTEPDWAPHRHWLEPHALDPVTDELQFPMQSYVVRTSHHTILIDSCVGNDKERPNRPSWHMKTDDTYMRALAALGIAAKDIDFVMCTHLHTDHIGWNTRLEDGRWVPTFPNARYIFSERELAAWRDVGHEKFSRTPYEDSVLPIVEAGRAELVTNDYALDDEVWLESTPGHTPDHVAIALASNGASAVMCGDILHSPVQCLHPEWEPWPDWDPGLAKRTRRAFLERYCDTDTLVCTAHFPLPSAGRVVRAGDAFRFEYDERSW
ncbi:MAG: MBL fold metallo-hydrolase [Gammaproteobacteria bacterium]|nr:MAG: MBL fold metallo-hydrolase [Gammaproteobacteria bacterium]